MAEPKRGTNQHILYLYQLYVKKEKKKVQAVLKVSGEGGMKSQPKFSVFG